MENKINDIYTREHYLLEFLYSFFFLFCFVFVSLYWRRHRACKIWAAIIFINYCFDAIKGLISYPYSNIKFINQILYTHIPSKPQSIKWLISYPFYFTQRFHRNDSIWFIFDEHSQEVSSVLWCWITCYYKGLGFCVRLKRQR